jgi:hypothetical protein
MSAPNLIPQKVSDDQAAPYWKQHESDPNLVVAVCPKGHHRAIHKMFLTADGQLPDARFTCPRTDCPWSALATLENFKPA